MLISVILTALIATGYDRLPELEEQARKGFTTGTGGVATVVTYADSPEVMALIAPGLGNLMRIPSKNARLGGNLFCPPDMLRENKCEFRKNAVSGPLYKVQHILRAEEPFLARDQVRWYVLFEDSKQHQMYVGAYVLDTVKISENASDQGRKEMSEIHLNTVIRTKDPGLKARLAYEMVIDIEDPEQRRQAVEVIDEFAFRRPPRTVLKTESPSNEPYLEAYERFRRNAATNTIAEQIYNGMYSYAAFMQAAPSPSSVDMSFYESGVYNGGFVGRVGGPGGYLMPTITNFTEPEDTLAYVSSTIRVLPPTELPRLVLLDDETERGTLRVIVHEIPKELVFSLRGEGLNAVNKLMSLLPGLTRDNLVTLAALRLPNATVRDKEVAGAVLSILVAGESGLPSETIEPQFLYKTKMRPPKVSPNPAFVESKPPAPPPDTRTLPEKVFGWTIEIARYALIAMLCFFPIALFLARRVKRWERDLKRTLARDNAENARVAAAEKAAAEEAVRLKRQAEADKLRARKIAERHEREVQERSNPTRAPVKTEVSPEEIAELEARIKVLVEDQKIPSAIRAKIRAEFAQAAEETRLARRKKKLEHALGHASIEP